MTTTIDLSLSLPEDLAREARDAGLLCSEGMEALLRERLQAARRERLRALWDRLPVLKVSEQDLRDVILGMQTAQAAKR